MIIYFHDLHLDSKINYGKHKGKTLQQIIETNYGWVEWAMENITGFALDVYAWFYLLEIEGVIVNSKNGNPVV